MARSLRIIEPGLWHHVMNRGQGGQSIFEDDRDREKFLTLLGECGSRWGVLPAAYCLMGNHYHALLLDEGGRLSRAMRHVDGVYTQWFNRRHKSDGSLMRGRFRSRVVQEEAYVAEVVRYIHTNPLGPGLAGTAADYRWSSHRVYLGQEKRPWCCHRMTLELIGFDVGDHVEAFDAFVHERVDPEREEQLATPRWSPILGDEAFVAQCRAKVREQAHLRQPEIPEGKRLVAIEPDTVIEVACEHFGLSRADLLRGQRGAMNLPRLLTLLLCQHMTPATGAALGSVFGVVSGTVSVLNCRTRAQVNSDPAVAASYTALKDGLLTKI